MDTKKMGLIIGFLGFFFVDGLLRCMARPQIRYYDFVLQESNFTKLCSTKSMLVVNGSFPGPTIRARRGDTVFVNVHNQGKYGVTIHWHGVKQPRNPWSDGPENITQCPIKPGASFTYEVILSTEEGTLWWHAHSDWTRVSVHGAIVISPAAGKTYPFPKPYKQKTIILASWYKQDVQAMITNSIETGVNPTISDAFTINGKPGNRYNCSSDSIYLLKVKYGKTYLLRIVNAVMNEEHFFAIAKHNLTVVGQDGAYIKPINTNYIMITPGQTMDVLFTANQNLSDYYMASSPYFDSTVQFDNSTTTAIVQYEGTHSAPSSPFFPNLPFYNNTDAAENFTKRVRSLASKEHPINVPKNITTRIYIAVSLNRLLCPNNSCNTTAGDRQSASLNNISFETPKIDILQAYYRRLGNVFNETFPSEPLDYFNFTGDVSNITLYTAQGTKARMINYGEVVEIVFQNTNLGAPESHPMHLHGFSFYLVGTGSGNFNNVTDPLTYNLVDPPQLNTINLPKNGWAAIRFVADNPGVWFMHCHLERHATWGMDTVIIVKNGKSKDQKIRGPPAHMPPCS
ncbi:laccase-14-like isoform X2 [Mangifera indica]|uniref:laccase-14-like isoform X2 n=1 Tax=Mangifera indica TaxID=29780 RepID=UPI001CFA02E2|nr:laccase-14-like isoform X2 [Mangifera indica]